jgi:oxygen-independent coproporphyrinogen-3 oxidase
VGVGPGAHGRLTLGGVRFATTAQNAILDYVNAVARDGAGSSRDRLDLGEIALERLLMGLRTVEGVDLAELAPLGVSPTRVAALWPMVRLEDGRLFATAQGRPVLDRVIAELAGG